MTAQCDLPPAEAPINTGANMTVMLLPNFVSGLNIQNETAYMIAFDGDLIVGYADLSGGISQNSFALWGDDSITPELDGASPDASISFQLIDGSSLYDVEVASPVSYITGAIGVQSNAPSSITLVCEPTICGDTWIAPFTGNTGANMTLMLTETFISSLNVQNDGAYLAATTSSGLVIGSTEVSDVQTSLVVWADDSFTEEVDGAAEGELVSLNLVDGEQLFSVDFTFNFVTNANQALSTQVSVTGLCTAELPFGCTDSEACNYDFNANTNDGTCVYVDGICDSCDDGIVIDNDSDNDGLCDIDDILSGCTDDTACNYNSSTTLNEDNSTCTYSDGVCDTCVDGIVVDNDSDDDGLCDSEDILSGCVDVTACNFDSSVTLNEDNTTCVYVDGVCESCEEGLVVDNDSDDDGLCDGEDFLSGCIDVTACNYNSSSTINEDNTTCTYVDEECESCEEGLITDNDLDNDGVCDANEIAGCQDELACNYNISATDTDDSCIFSTDLDACATCSGEQDGTGVVVDNDLDNDGVCNADELEGCTDETACNYSSFATDDDASCTYTNGICDTCVDGNIVDNDQDDDGVCDSEEIIGCQDNSACNYHELATDAANCIFSADLDACATCSGEQDGTGVIVDNDADDDAVCDADEVLGCDESEAFNFSPTATENDGSCFPFVYGCMNDPSAYNFNDIDGDGDADFLTNIDGQDINTDDGSCYQIVLGCTDLIAFNFNDIDGDGEGDELTGINGVDVNTDDGSCIAYILGCTNINSCTYQANVIHDIFLCDFPPVNYFCDTIEFSDEVYVYEISCNNDSDDDGICDENEIEGCTSSSIACNYNPDATDEVDCIFADEFFNCSGSCLVDSDQDGVCDELEIIGCTDNTACNYNENATESDVCEYAFENYDCNGVCVDDEDGDGICNVFEIEGCTSDWAENFNSLATDDDGSCILEGCTNSNYIEYDVNATDDDGSCLQLIEYGCTLLDACNYNEEANTPDGSCAFPEFEYVSCDGSCVNGEDSEGNCIQIIVEGCMDEFACNYFPEANLDTEPTSCTYNTEFLDCAGNCILDDDGDGVCDQLEIFGCTDVNACNYNLESTENSACVYPAEIYLDCNNQCVNDTDEDGICDQFDLESCGDELASNFNPFASEINNELCEYPSGCTDPIAANYDPLVMIDDGSCLLELIDCTDANFLEYNPIANINHQESCVTPVVLGCMDPNAIDYNPDANINNYVCSYDVVVGCMNPDYLEFNPQATEDFNPTLCIDEIAFGCTNSNFLEYDSSANVDDGTCQSIEYEGCLDEDYQEYNSSYTVHNEYDCLTPHIHGCTNSYSVGSSYNPYATIDDGSCILIGCSDTTFAEYYMQGYTPNIADESGVYNSTFCVNPAILGCINSYALNYNPQANVATEDCIYEDGDYIDFESSITDISCSILMPNYGPADVNGSNVSFSGEFTQPFPEGSTIGVFYHDYSGVLQCGGASIWSATSTNSISAYIDDYFTPAKDGFNENEAFNWRVQTPEGLLYSINVIINENSIGGNQFTPNGLIQVGHMYTQFMYQVDIVGCMDSAYVDFNPYANNPGPCYVLKDIGCMDAEAFNYNSNATEDDGSCYPIIYGCNDPSAFNYVQPIDNLFVDPNTSDGTCIPVIEGCLSDIYAYNFSPITGNPLTDVNTDDSSCYEVVLGCTDIPALNFNDLDGDGFGDELTGQNGVDINTDDGSCIQKIYGCMEVSMFNYNPDANINNGVCYPVIIGCVEDELALNYIAHFGNPYLDVNDTVPCILPIYGCMDPLAYNYVDTATVHDQSCIARVYGCTDNGITENIFGDVNDLFLDGLPSANFDSLANTDDGSCYPIIEGCIDTTAFNFNNYGSNSYISYAVSDDVFTDVNTSDNSCIEVKIGCLDVEAYNYNDFDLDGVENPLFDPEEDVNTHLQSECFYRPGCTDPAYAQYWNYSFLHQESTTMYPDSMLNINSCVDSANFFCNDNIYVEHYIRVGESYINYAYQSDISLVASQSECLNIRVDYCEATNYVGYYFTDNIIDGSDIDAGANFGIPEYLSDFMTNGSDLNPGNEPLCGEPVSLYCNDSTLTGYFAGNNVAEGTMHEEVDGNIIDDSLCGEVQVDRYCEDDSFVGYFNVNDNGDYDFNLGHNAGNIIDASLCGDTLLKYCDNLAFVGYYLGDSVGVQNVGTIIDDLVSCGDSAIFYCNDSSFLGYYTDNYVQGGISLGTHVDNSIENCIEPIDPHCSDPAFFEYYVDTLMLSTYQGNIINDELCVTIIVPGCTDESMFNYASAANINRTSLEDDSDPCYPIVYGCLNPESFNFNNYYSDNNINPNTGELYQDGDLELALFGPVTAQDSILQSSFYDGTGNGINVNTTIPTDSTTVYSGGCIPIVYGCTDDQSLNFNDWSPAATIENLEYGDGIADSWNYPNPWLNVNTDDGSCIEIISGCTNSSACNYLETANAEDGNCIIPATHYNCDNVCINDSDSDGVCDELEVIGCVDETAFNFNSAATDDDGSCIATIVGCMSEGYFNYDSLANVDSGNCEDYIFGCTDSAAFNFNPFANTSTNFTCYPIVEGCLFDGAFNYNDYDGDGVSNSITGANGVDVNTNDGSCIASVFGCIDPLALNFDSLANTDNGSCIELVLGCTNSSAQNYESAAMQDDGSCIYGGCTDPEAFNYNADVDIDDGSCILTVIGCMIPEAFNFDSLANVQGFCIDVVLGCTDPTAFNFNPQANTENEISNCVEVILGCTNPNAIGYNPEAPANTDDGSCVIVVDGCTDSTAVNYQDFANTLDGSCLYLGCTDSDAANYNSQANIDDGTCIASVIGCTDSTAFNFNPIATINNALSCISVVEGCLNPYAFNFNPNANVSDGLCEPFVYGCTDNGLLINGLGEINDIDQDGLPALNYNPNANVNQVSENDISNPCISNIPGCMYAEALNFNPDATISDNSCVLNIPGCMDSLAINYNEYATVQSTESCSYIVEIIGCMNENAFNYDINATVPSGLCEPFVFGCTNNLGFNYNEDANTEDESCISVVFGCTNPLYVEFNSEANTEDNSCSQLIIYGCMDSGQAGFDFDGDELPAYNYDPLANVDLEPSTCVAQIVGCNIPGMPCFDSVVNTAAEDIVESCFYSCNNRTRADTTFFCADPLSSNYNLFFDSLGTFWSFSPFNPAVESAYDCSYNVDGYDIYCVNEDDEIYILEEDMCEFVEGCTDNGLLTNGLGEINDVNDDGLPAFNYSSNAVIDDGSCEAILVGCNDLDYLEYDEAVNTQNAALCITEIEYGCTDPNSFNYEPTANVDDDSCTPIVLGCLDDSYLEYNEEANTAVLDEFGANQLCVTPIVNGCIDPDYLEYWDYNSVTFEIAELIPTPNTQIEGACVSPIVFGCADPVYLENWNYDLNTHTITEFVESPNVDDGSCDILIIEGCTDFEYLEYSSENNVEDNSCLTPINPGCTNSDYLEYFDYDTETNTISEPDPVYNIGSDSDYCSTLIVFGCTDLIANNYDESANVNQLSVEDATSSCEGESGCTNSSANNYNEDAVTDDGSCVIEGCLNSNAENYNEEATLDDGSCIILGCNDESALNYDLLVTHLDGSCIYEFIYGCMDPTASNYDDTATINQISAEDESDPCITFVYGCTDASYVEYYDYSYSDALQFVITEPTSIPNTDDGSCITEILEGCTDANYLEYSSIANTYQAEACIVLIEIGCTDEAYLEYDEAANFGDPVIFCLTLITNGCTDPLYLEYNENATLDDGSCTTLIVDGCMDADALNYDVEATLDDGSCIDLVSGCTDNGFSVNGSGVVNDIDGDGITAFNYNAEANFDDGSCETVIMGCTDNHYIENWVWNPIDYTISPLENSPNTDDGSCDELLITDCIDSDYIEYNSEAHLSNPDLCITLIVNGCTDSLFVEYHTQGSVANIDDGSCLTDAIFGCANIDYLEYYGFIDFSIPIDVNDYLAGLDTDSIANVDNGSCATPIIIGCYNSIATNHNPQTTVYDISICEGAVGCTHYEYIEYDSLAIIDNGSCINLIAYGCLDASAFNFNIDANVEDGSCYPVVEGCLDDTYYNYNDYDFDGHPNDQTEIGGVDVNTNNTDYCIDIVSGCTDNGAELNGSNLINDVGEDLSSAYNYNPLANTENGSCYPVIFGCMNSEAYNFNDYDFDGVGNYFTGIDGVDINTEYETSNCIAKVYGCLNDVSAYNYNDYDSDGETNPITGIAGVDVNTDDASCYDVVIGCMDPEAFNYNDYDYDAEGNVLTGIDGTDVNTADDSCFPVIVGCLDTNAFNYNDVDGDGNSNEISGDNFIDFNTHDSSVCEYLGCTNFTAANYDTYGLVLTSFGELVPATIDNGSCVIPGCTLESFPNYNSEATDEDGSCDMNSLDIFGCTDDNFLEYNPNVTIENGSCDVDVIYGCLDPDMFNFNPIANLDDGSCVQYHYGCLDESFVEYSSTFNSSNPLDCITPIVLGCTNSLAENYNQFANTDDGSCSVFGCTDVVYVEYSEAATQDDGSCIIIAIPGCTDSNYLEYWDWDYSEYNAQLHILFAPNNEAVNQDDGSCATELIFGCFYETYLEYNIYTNVFDVSFCQTLEIHGCVDPLASNYDIVANVDDGSCVFEGCTNPLAFNYNPNVNTDNGSCVPYIYGCTLEEYSNYNPAANVDDGTCTDVSSDIIGCLDEQYFEYDTNATLNDQSYCVNFMVFGCMDEEMSNYNADVNFDDGSCIPFVYGCTNVLYLEFDPTVNSDDGSCSTVTIQGCIEESAINYSPLANFDDGSCIATIEGCTDTNYIEYNSEATLEDGSCTVIAIPGCTDPLYIEYYAYTQNIEGIYVPEDALDSTINFDDGSCQTLIIADCVYDDFVEYNSGANVSVPDNCINIHVPGCTNELAFNYDEEATIDDESCLIIVPGCMDQLYVEFNPEANLSIQDSCMTIVNEGVNACNNPNYAQYYSYEFSPVGLFILGDVLNDGANVEYGCIDLLVVGCPYDQYVEYNPEANVYDFSDCIEIVYEGCTDDTALNYDSLANTDNGTCVPYVIGCMDPLYLEYNANATVDNGTCALLVVYGCTDSTAFNYSPLANTNDFSCLPTISGCMDVLAFNYNPLANVDDGTCVEVILGCTDNGLFINGANMINDADGDLISAFNFNSDANTDNGSCETVSYGCLDELAYNFNSIANTDDGSCIEVVLGCTDGTAFNYESIANTDDGSCYPVIYGCMDTTANNFNDYDGDLIGNPITGDVQVDVNVDNGVCIDVVFGCTDPIAQNFNQSANNDNGLCEYIGCQNESADNYNPLATLPGFCQYNGCTDPTATNFNPQANEDDGTCIPIIEGCNYPEFLEYNPEANVNNGSCLNSVIYGCMNELAMNYAPTANTNQVSFEDLSNPCIGYVFGCTDNGLSVNGLGEVNDVDGDSLPAFNYNSNANTDDGSCIAVLLGCMNPNSLNYNSEANTNDGTCMPFIWGCTDSLAFNFNANANSDDGSCYEVIEGCMNPLAFNYNSIANSNDGSCTPFIYGCTNEASLNYNPLANSEDGSCIEVVLGCMNLLASNYNPLANSNNGSCIAVIYGCTDPSSINYNENATIDNGNCVAIVSGCTNPFAANFNTIANQDDGSCVFVIEGCTDATAFNYDENATVDNGSCSPVIFGCLWDFADNYNPAANTDDGTCTFGGVRVDGEVCIDPIAENYFPYLDPSSPYYQSSLEGIYLVDNSTCEYIYGCTDPTAYNYNSSATVDDGSCVDETNVLIGCMDENYLEYNADANIPNMNMCLTLIVEGCTDFNAANFNPLANVNDGSCITEFIYGCTDSEALNYNPFSNTDDGSCEYEGIFGCTDPNYIEYNQNATEDDETCATLIVYGCTDPSASNYIIFANISDESCEYDGCLDAEADNYDPNATEDDGSCIYSGCMNTIACNYDNTANEDDGTCVYPAESYLDCNNQCINDSDADGICDELEIEGCTDLDACNYDANASDDGVCVYAEPLLDCSGNCLQDQDSDGVCDELEIEGCMDPEAANYEENATNAAVCEYDGCMDNAYLEFNPDATVDLNNSCQTLIVYGCTNELAENFDVSANVDDGTCNILGCTDPIAENYNEVANQDDGSCLIHGCTDENMFNYNEEANFNDGSCIPYIYGCTNSSMYNYNEEANTEDNSCIPFTYGCTDPSMLNFDEEANTNDDSCEPIVEGCMDELATNYNSEANTDDDSCIDPVYGCTNPDAENYDELATTDDESCVVYGCINDLALNYDTDATISDGSCIIYGCTLSDYPNFNSEATMDDGSCEMSSSNIYGCSDELFTEFDETVTIDNGTCITLVVFGCIETSAFNYEEEANTDNGTCYPVIEGCLDLEADNWNTPTGNVLVDVNTSDPEDCIYYGCIFESFPNYDPIANADDGSCDMNSTDVFGCTNSLYMEYNPEANQDNNTCEVLIVEGCTDSGAYNYDENANVDDGSCTAVVPGCTDSSYLEFNPDANTDDGSCVVVQHQGCTDSEAVNYDPIANVDDGSCIEAIYGCMDPFYIEFNVDANIDTDPSLCETLKIYGCTDISYLEYWNFTQLPSGYYVIGDPINEGVNFDDGSCMIPITIGCIYDSFLEYNSEANVYESNDCVTLIVEGCTQVWADNYSVDSNVDDGSCFKMGCVDAEACNYDEISTNDNGSCAYPIGCDTCTGEVDGLGLIVDNDADDDGVCDVEEIEGCTDASACNYDAASTTDTNNDLCTYAADLDGCATCSGETDGTGVVVDNDADNDGVCDADELLGCSDESACNYDATLTTDTDNDLCIYAEDVDLCATCSGETDGTGVVVDNDADDDGVCDAFEVEGCMDNSACNFNVSATDTDDSCIYPIGCDSCTGENDGTGAIVDNDIDNDGVCDAEEIEGCTDATACNYDATSTTDMNPEMCTYANDLDACATCSGETDGTGIIVDNDIDDDGVCDVDEVEGCTDSLMDNYNENATNDDGTCYKEGCTSDWADNYDSIATTDDGSCYKEGCIYEWSDNYDSIATTDDGSCYKYGCTYEGMFNYDPQATDSDGSCIPFIYGCIVDSADNYNPSANTQEGVTCFFTGCIDPSADNYLDVANIASDCEYWGCMNEFACNYDSTANVNYMCDFPTPYYDCDSVCISDVDSDGICDELEEYGCTDVLALNFDSLATEDNFTCYYPLQVELIVNNAVCKDGLGSAELIITGGLAPIEVNTFGLNLNAIPPGEGYVIYVSDDSGNEYSFGGSELNFLAPFDVVAPEDQLQVVIDYDENDQEVSFATNADNYDFDWYIDNTLDLSITTELIVDLENGLYGVSVTDEFGCTLYVDTLVSTVGIQELFLDGLEMYPNPTSGLVHVNFSLPQSSVSTVSVISLTGTKLYSIELEETTKVETTLRLFDLNAGVYFVEIEVDNKKLYRRLSVK
jgi:hypothetical protein